MGWGEEHTTGGVADVLAAQPCPWCKGQHTGRCPQVRAIEFHPNGVVKRVEFITDPPLPSPAQRWPTIEGENGAQVSVPDLGGRDVRKPLPSVGP